MTAAPAVTMEALHAVRLRHHMRRKYGATAPRVVDGPGLLEFTTATMPGFRVARHHEMIAAKLEAVERGEINRLIIVMPPRHGKTEVASIRFPAWYLGRHPDHRVIGASYAASLAYRISRHTRNIIASPEWPYRSVALADDLTSVQQWDLAGRRGGYVAAGVGGGITGHGANCLIIDDALRNQEDADSAIVREHIWDWYTSTAYTRLEAGGAVVVIGTRWHHDDLIGRLLRAANEGGDRFDLLHLPALSADGAALWPERFDEEALGRIKVAVGSRVFSALYQGQPSNDIGAILQRHWWRRYTEVPHHLEHVIQSWDLAITDTAGGSYVVGQVWGKSGADSYLLDQVRGRMDFPATLEAMRLVTRRWPAALTKLVENKANGPAVIATLRREIPGIVAVEPQGSKTARASAVSGVVEAGNVHLPVPLLAGWVDDLVEELTTFPTGTHDDQVDALSQALIHLYDIGSQSRSVKIPGFGVVGGLATATRRDRAQTGRRRQWS